MSGTKPSLRYWRRCNRSGLSLNVGVIIYNHSYTPFIITRGDRIAQLICERISYTAVEEVQTLDYTESGAEWFGTT